MLHYDHLNRKIYAAEILEATTKEHSSNWGFFKIEGEKDFYWYCIFFPI